MTSPAEALALELHDDDAPSIVVASRAATDAAALKLVDQLYPHGLLRHAAASNAVMKLRAGEPVTVGNQQVLPADLADGFQPAAEAQATTPAFRPARPPEPPPAAPAAGSFDGAEAVHRRQPLQHVRATPDGGLRARAVEGGKVGRLVEATSLERERHLRRRYPDADRFLEAWQAGEW